MKKLLRRFRPLLWASVVGIAACHEAAPSTPVSEAIATGDAKRVEALLKAGHSPDEGSPRPIVWAARAGQVESIRALVAAGVDVNAMDRGGYGWTPLQHALHKRESVAARALVEAGADVARHGTGQMPPLMMAAGYGDLSSVKLLLEAVDRRARALRVSRNHLIVRALEREMKEGTEWSPGFFEQLDEVDEATSKAADELLATVRSRRRSKEPQCL